jgi:hypothetical protein
MSSNIVTRSKLLSLNTTNLTPEQLYVNSIILQIQDAALKGSKQFLIAIPPPYLNSITLKKTLTSSLVNCVVKTVITNGIAGYQITWN